MKPCLSALPHQPDYKPEPTFIAPCLQSVHHVAESFASIAHTIDQLAKSVVSLQGAIQVQSHAAC